MKSTLRHLLGITIGLALTAGVPGAWQTATAASTCLVPLSPCGTPDVRIRAALNLEDGTVRATTEIRFTNCADVALDELPVLMAAALHGAPTGDLTDRNFSWRFPGGVSRSSCEVEASESLEGPHLARELLGPCAALSTLALATPLQPGETLAISLTTRVKAPARFGTFGAARGMLTLRGGWHPSLPTLEASGFRIPAGPGRVRFDVEVSPSRSTRVLLGTHLDDAGPKRAISWSGVSWDPLALVAAPDLRRTTVREGSRRIDLIHRSKARPAGDPYTPGELLQTDWLPERIAGLRRVLRDLRDPFDSDRWTLVVVPMKENLAVPGGDLIFVAESLYEITRVDLLTRYHDAALASALITGSLRRERPATDPWLALVTGAWLRARLRGTADLGAVRDLARKGEFIYAIDQFATDARIPQEHLFFQRVQDHSSFEGESEFIARDLPSPWAASQLLQEIDAVRAVERSGSERPVGADGAAALTGARWASAFCAWVEGGHLEELDLSVRVTPTRRPDGAQATLVEARRVGPGSGIPVRVRLEHENGGTRDVVWDTSRKTVRWRVGGRVQRALVDPDARILQRRDRPTRDLRFDDASSRDLKLVFARPWVSFESGARIPTASVEIDLQRRHDLRSTWVLQPRLFPQRAELLIGHRWGFGQLASQNRNRWNLTVGLKGAAGFEGGGSFSPGVKALLYYDTRTGSYAPYRGGWAYTYAEAFPGDTQGGWRLSSKFGFGGAKVFGTRPDLVFVLRGLADTRVGETPAWEHLEVGGIFGVRGLVIADFAPGHRLAASAELRWMPARNLRASFGKTLFLRAVQLVLFTDAALIGTDHDEWFEERYLYQSAGLGIRLHAELFGVFPVLLSIDEAAVLPLYGKQLSFGTLAYFSQAF
ncbi:MAG: hypothetical protein ABIK09_07245 [Pseudomonadota bacterium]